MNQANNPHYQMFIDGQWTDGADGQTMQSISPIDGKPWASFACACAIDVERVIAAARRNLQTGEWASMNATARGKLLYKLADKIEDQAQVIAQVETKDSGKLLTETTTQTKYTAEYYRYFAGLADKMEGTVVPIDKPDMQVFTTPEPIGVVVAIVPWNAQMFLTATKLAPALAAGCTVVLKASELAPCAIFELAKLIEQCGFPKGVISVMTGDAENCAIPLTAHPDVDRIAFTGGPTSAKHVVRNSAENFAVTTLELGGKSPILVFEDADIKSAINGLIAGNFGASGQSCVAGSRAFIHCSIFDEMIAGIHEKIQQVVIGDPFDAKTHIGPLCTMAQITCIEQTLGDTLTQGGEIIFGGKRAQGQASDYFFEPTLVLCKKSTATLTTEMFGPVMSVVPFDTEEEAVVMANDTAYGLGSGIFTENLARAHRVSKQIRAGICWVNTYRAISPIAPFGGFNQSGYGREAGVGALFDYTRSKTTWINTSSKPMDNPFLMR